MRLAYLVNQYPKTSHSFVRREIRALEEQGFGIERFAIRRPDEPLPDVDDQAEQDLTTTLLDDKSALLTAFAKLALTHPIRLARAFALMTTMARKAGQDQVRHLAYLIEAAHLGAELRSRKITHVHAHFGTNSTTVAMLCATLWGTTYSFTVHGPEEFDRPSALGLDVKIEHATFVVAISEYGRSQLYRWCDYEHWSKIHIIHCTVDSSFLAAEPSPVPETPMFVCVGRLCEQKGQMLLLEAAIELSKERSLQVLFVGDGEFREPMEELIAQYDLGRSIRILGWQSSAAVRKTLRAGRALVLPSFAEGLPVVIMEALALGRPVISTYVAGIPELVNPGENGWLVPAGSVPDLVDAMRSALELPVERLSEMGRAGHRSVATEHRDSTEAAKLGDIFRRVVPLEPRRHVPRLATDRLPFRR